MSMNTRLLLITFLCVFSIGQCIAQTWYTGKDNFRQAIFQDSILSDYMPQFAADNFTFVRIPQNIGHCICFRDFFSKTLSA